MGVGLILAGLFFGSAFLYRQRFSVVKPADTGVSGRNVSHQQLITEYKEAIILLNAGRFNDAKLKLEEYLSFESYLNTVGDATNIGPAKIQLADSYFYLGEREKAVKILREVIATPSLPDGVRAGAFIRLGNYFYETFDQRFAREVIFGSTEMRRLFDENDVERSVSNLYNEAAKINPFTIIGYYGRGIYYSNKLLSQNNLSESERDTYLGYVSNDMGKGDAVFLEVVAGRQPSSVATKAFAYQLRAKLLFAMHYADPSLQEENERIRTDFETAINLFTKSGKSVLRAEYQYIIWMLQNDKAGNADAIKSMTDDFYKKLSIADGTDVQRDMFVEFLKNIRSYPEHYYYLGAVLIGENDARVKDFLVGIGWPQEAFGKGQ